MGKKFLGAIGVAVLAVAISACESEPYEAGTVGGRDSASDTDDADATDNTDSTPEPTPDDTDEAEPEPSPDDEAEFDLCEAIPAERIQELAGRADVPEVGEQDRAEASDEDGDGIFECTYKWEPGETHQLVRISAARDAGNANAAEYVESILGPEHEPVDGVGEAAGIDRDQRFGNQISALATAGQTESGLAGVLVLGADGFDTEVFTGIAAEVFGALD